MEVTGIEPVTSHMRSKRSTTEIYPLCLNYRRWIFFSKLDNYHHPSSLVDGALETKFNLQKRFTITENAYYY